MIYFNIYSIKISNMWMKIIFFIIIMALVIGAFVGNAEPILWPFVIIAGIVVAIFLAIQKDE